MEEIETARLSVYRVSVGRIGIISCTAPDKLGALEQDSTGAVDSLLKELFCSEPGQWEVSTRAGVPGLNPSRLAMQTG